jgi:hypothetical protein
VLGANAAVGLDALATGERRAVIAVGVGAACTASRSARWVRFAR